jgi:hypothetical protein
VTIGLWTSLDPDKDTELGASIQIDSHDALFASRTSAAEWQRIKSFRDLPDFLDGARRHEGVAKHLFTNNLILNKVVLEAWRFQILAITLYLHETFDPDDPKSGLTYSTLSRACAQLQLASSGRVFAFLNLMKLGGYLKSVRSTADSRIVHLKPTPTFMKTVDEWTDGIFASIDAADPTSNLLARSKNDPSFGMKMRTSGAKGLLDGWQPLEPFPEVTHFASSDGGWMLMEQLAAASLHHPHGLRIDPININLRAFAKDAGGSRSNLSRLLEKAYELGLLDAPPQSGSNIILSSRMLCSFLTFIASYLNYYQSHISVE